MTLRNIKNSNRLDADVLAYNKRFEQCDWKTFFRFEQKRNPIDGCLKTFVLVWSRPVIAVNLKTKIDFTQSLRCKPVKLKYSTPHQTFLFELMQTARGTRNWNVFVSFSAVNLFVVLCLKHALVITSPQSHITRNNFNFPLVKLKN